MKSRDWTRNKFFQVNTGNTRKRAPLLKIQPCRFLQRMEPSNENSKGRKINILSLDGGGIRGLSSLIILKHLSFRCKKPVHTKFIEKF